MDKIIPTYVFFRDWVFVDDGAWLVLVLEKDRLAVSKTPALQRDLEGSEMAHSDPQSPQN